MKRLFVTAAVILLISATYATAAPPQAPPIADRVTRLEQKVADLEKKLAETASKLNETTAKLNEASVKLGKVCPAGVCENCPCPDQSQCLNGQCVTAASGSSQPLVLVNKTVRVGRSYQTVQEWVPQSSLAKPATTTAATMYDYFPQQRGGTVFKSNVFWGGCSGSSCSGGSCR